MNRKEEVFNELDKDEFGNEFAVEICEVNFDHMCGNSECNHIIAPHFYRSTESVSGENRLMDCPLCGYGQVANQYTSEAAQEFRTE